MDVAEKFKINIEKKNNGTYFIKGRQNYVPANIDIEGDYSQAGFYFHPGLHPGIFKAAPGTRPIHTDPGAEAEALAAQAGRLGRGAAWTFWVFFVFSFGLWYLLLAGTAMGIMQFYARVQENCTEWKPLGSCLYIEDRKSVV